MSEPAKRGGLVSQKPIMMIADCLKLTDQLDAVTDTARLDLEVLLCWVLKKDRAFLYTWPETQLSAEEMAQFDEAVLRRKQGEPIAYIVGEKEFWSLPLRVNRAVLIPRPDTEILVETALEKIAPAMTILDLGTGSGAIALALASERPDCKVIAVDIAPAAVELAKDNMRALGLNNLAIWQSDWFSHCDTRQFDIIVANPPYIDKHDPHLSRGDLRFEPEAALVAADAGLADIRKIIRGAKYHLRENGWLMLEHGWRQGAAVKDIFKQEKYRAVKTVSDLSGNDRVTIGRKPMSG